ncbi:unnamed protein product, partial [Prunus brigantina]
MENNGSKEVVFQSMQLQVGDVLNLLKGIKEMLLIICILIVVNVVFNLVTKMRCLDGASIWVKTCFG